MHKHVRLRRENAVQTHTHMQTVMPLSSDAVETDDQTLPGKVCVFGLSELFRLSLFRLVSFYFPAQQYFIYLFNTILSYYY
jgi:hypothetical protein